MSTCGEYVQPYTDSIPSSGMNQRPWGCEVATVVTRPPLWFLFAIFVFINRSATTTIRRKGGREKNKNKTNTCGTQKQNKTLSIDINLYLYNLFYTTYKNILEKETNW